MDVYAERLTRYGISDRRACIICFEYVIKGDYDGLDKYIDMMERDVYVD